MTAITRKNAWNDNGTFDNPDLLWYAKAVQVMMSRALNDPTSWWFFAAIHGQYLVDNDTLGTTAPVGFPNWADLPGPPNVPTTPVPTTEMIDQYWDQCQHAGWFFPPWHRGYIYAIENVLRDIIKGLNGPDDWALPYWNYFGPNSEYEIPPAFTQQTLPDNTANPLYVSARYGPNGDGNIYVPLSAWSINEQCQQDTVYTGDAGYYGGGETGFSHFDSNTGDLEQNPHNLVHSAVGGQPSSTTWGLMSDPGLAALDPIFYLHHCNIDRMWAAWTAAGNSNPTDTDWLNGPTATGDRKFYMPNPDKTAWQYTPAMVNNISQLNYTYEDLSLTATPALLSRNAQRFGSFAMAAGNLKNAVDMSSNKQSELVGANSTSLTLGATGARTTVRLDSRGWNKVSRSIGTAFAASAADSASETSLPDEVFLQLEGVKGNADANVYAISVNHRYVAHVSLFGIRMASTPDSEHGGAGLNIRVDISKIVDELQLSNDVDPSSLDVLIEPVGPNAAGDVTVDRVSVYRKSQ